MVKSGTTSFSDMFNPIGVDQDAIMETVSGAGCELLFQGLYLASERKDDEKKAIEEAEKYVKRYYKESGMLTTMVAPHSPYTCSTELLERVCSYCSRESNDGSYPPF